ncbi:MAG: alcohol dehydrogenase catalytic domain-containing protein [Oscillospiraceae bacterium]|nr:alcohol dehydrogenase catalytic domain-containing protein [Oscillospiraceae bacterium]
MINYIYQLTSPQFFSVKYVDIDINKKVIVRPRYMSICHADQRYYLGNRDLKVLNEKLPMALIHECCGQVVMDKTGQFQPGQLVVMIPNQPANSLDVLPGDDSADLTEGHNIFYENYRSDSKFLSSGADGFMREFVDIAPDRLIPFEDIPLQTAAITEFVSVACHAVSRLMKVAHNRRENIGVWGDGALSYVIATVLRATMPKSKIYVIGKNQRKLSRFSFVTKTFLTYNIPKDFKVDHAFECVGGEGSPDAINDMIQYANPQATLMLMGVSENRVPINTRLVLEKGISLIGCSRSGRADFESAISLMATQRVRRRLSSIIYEDAPVKNFDDMHRAFAADLNTPFKTVFEWKV